MLFNHLRWRNIMIHFGLSILLELHGKKNGKEGDTETNRNIGFQGHR